MCRRGWCPILTGVALLLAVGCRQEFQTPVSLEDDLLRARWTDVDKAAEQWSRNPAGRRQALVVRGYAALMRGLPHQAESRFLAARANSRLPFDTRWAQSLVDRHPREAVAQLLFADALARAGDRVGALNRLDVALAIDPHLGGARLARATLVAFATPEASAADLEQLASGTLFSADARLVRAMVRVQRNDWLGAFEDLDVALDLAPDLASAYNARGVLRARTGHWKTASADFERCFQLEPALEECRQNWRLLQRDAARASSVAGSLTIYVTDFGAESWNRTQQMMGDFSTAKTHGIAPGLSHAGEILVPMPERVAASEPERQALSERIAVGIKARIGSAKVDVFEVRITENLKGRRCALPIRKGDAADFGEIAYRALDQVKKDLAGRGVEVTMPAIMAGAAAYVFTEVVARVSANPFDSVVLLGGCAYPNPTLVAYAKMDSRLRILNSALETPAPDTVADHAVAAGLHARMPGLKVYWEESRGPGDVATIQDLVGVQPERVLLVREGGQVAGPPPAPIKARDLVFWQPIPRRASPLERGGVSLSPSYMVQGPGGGVKFKSVADEDLSFELVGPIFNVKLR